MALLAACALLSPKATLAGGPFSLTRSDISGTQIAYLSCSCDTGYYDVLFQNDDTVALTVVGTKWTVGPIAPGQEATYRFTDPGSYVFSLAEATSLSGSVTILNSAPEFSDATLSISSITTDKLTLTWPAAMDDGPTISYKVYQNNVLVKTTTERTLVVSSLTQNTSYSFRVVAYDASGESTETFLSASAVTKQEGSGSYPNTKACHKW